MKISLPAENLSPSALTAQPKSQKTSQASQYAEANSVAKSEKAAGVAVTVSKLAQTLAISDSAQTAVVDAKKVEAVRSDIKKGTFQINPEVIADKMLANAQEFLQRSRT